MALNLREEQFRELVAGHKPIPITALEKSFVEYLTKVACLTAMERHAGGLIDIYSTQGRKKAASGKDLTAVRFIVGTGGALTRLPAREEILRSILTDLPTSKLAPGNDSKILIDSHYIMASVGVLSKTYPEAALGLLRQSLGDFGGY